MTGECEKMEQQNSEKIRRQIAHILYSKCVGETAGRRGDNTIRYDTIQYNTMVSLSADGWYGTFLIEKLDLHHLDMSSEL